MRILYLCHCFPYSPNKGDKIRAFHELKHLGSRHEVHLLALGDPQEIADHRDDLKEYCEKVEAFPLNRAVRSVRSALGVLGRKPLTLHSFHSAALRRRVKQLAQTKRFDLVLAYSSAMAPYATMFEKTPRVLDMVDVDSAKWAQYAGFASFPKHLVYHLESRRLRAYEASLANRFEKVLLTTTKEVDLLTSFAPTTKAQVIRNGICQDTFRPLDLPRAKTPTLLFVGQMDYFPNVDGACHFAQNIFPSLKRRFKDLQFTIVGRSPTPRVLALERIEGVVVTGTVADVRPFLARSTVFVAPLRVAQGVQNKVLEAMASRIPVVCSGSVFSGLADSGFESGRDLLVAKRDLEFAEAVGDLLENPRQRQRITEAGRTQLAAAHSWDRNMRELDRVLSEVARKAGPGLRVAAVPTSSPSPGQAQSA